MSRLNVTARGAVSFACSVGREHAVLPARMTASAHVSAVLRIRGIVGDRATLEQLCRMACLVAGLVPSIDTAVG